MPGKTFAGMPDRASAITHACTNAILYPALIYSNHEKFMTQSFVLSMAHIRGNNRLETAQNYWQAPDHPFVLMIVGLPSRARPFGPQ